MFAETARFALTFGAAGACVAAAMGWMAALGEHFPEDQVRTIFIHRWVGVSVAIISLTAAILSHLQKKNKRLLIGYRMALLVSAILVGIAGHFGAALIYGTDYFTW